MGMGVRMETSANRLGIESGYRKLTEILIGEDPLGVVIRAHIHIEQEVIEFIRARSHPPDAILAITDSYGRRVRLALKLGLRNDFGKPLEIVGGLRNRFAHRADAVIEKEDADKLDAALPSDVASMIHNAYRATSGKLSPSENSVPFEQLNPKDQVSLHLVNLWASVAVAAAKAKGVGAINRPPGSLPIALLLSSR